MSGESRQCIALTKSGNRCKNRAQSGSDFCSVHHHLGEESVETIKIPEGEMAENVPPTQEDEVVDENPRDEEEVEPIATSAPNAGDKKWQRIALFQVEFQKRRSEGAVAEQRTVINYHETDKWHEWQLIETDEIGQWIVEQAGDKLRPEPLQVPKVKPETETTIKLSVNVTSARLYQPAGTEVSLAPRKNGRPYFGVVKAGHPFAAEVDFEYGEESTAAVEKQEISYQAQFYAQNRDTGSKLHLGDSEPGQLARDKATYSASLSGITLPPGRYRIQVLVTTDLKDSVPSYVEVPVLEAV